MDFGARELARWYEGVDKSVYCPWHFVIRRSGKVEDGRPLKLRGQIQHGFNAISLGVMLVGGQSGETYGKMGPIYGQQQFEALRQLLTALLPMYPGVRVVGHCNLPAALPRPNPGFNVSAWLKEQGIDPNGSAYPIPSGDRAAF